MNPGQLTILITFIASLGAAWFFFTAPNGQDPRNRPQKERKPGAASGAAIRLYHVATASVVVSSILLYYHLLSHSFEYSYVAHYSSRSLPMLYLISSFWAGQEGTFLLWALMVAVMGLVLINRQGVRSGYAPALVSLYIAFLHLLMLVQSPFEMTTAAPADGQGMNPLLQDPWMAIHPPILFVGYAAAIFPFALAMAGLATRKYDAWKALGFRWTLFAATTLGAGIIIGGFWAYEVLGWGGYWGWDPVENSSLVPWLMLLALVHGLVVERGKGALRRTNIFLAIIVFLLVLYATFLTRSGVLADFSVHSFVDLGINNYLVGVMAVTALFGFGLFGKRFREIESPPVDHRSFNREIFLVLSIYALSASAAFTFVGMSSPIFTGLLGKASQVDTSFYNQVNLPVATVIALLLGVTPFLGWAGEKSGPLLKRLSLPLVLTILAGVIAFVAGVTDPMMLFFTAMSAFALVSNTIIAFRQYRSGLLSLGGPVGHIGAALLLLGIVGSGNFTESRKVLLKENEPQGVFGYDVTFRGMQPTPDGKNIVMLEVSDGVSKFQGTPKLYYSEYNKGVMREPHIKVLPLKDLYLSPMELQESGGGHNHPSLELTMGEKKEINGYEIEFQKFDMSQHNESGAMMVGAVLNVPMNGTDHRVVPTVAFNRNGQKETGPVAMPARVNPSKGTVQPQVILTGMQVEAKKILLEFHGFEGDEATGRSAALLLDVSMIPMMMVLWTGVVLIIAGSLIAFLKRLKSDAVTMV
jgi:cytochrome c-type biogenesis protein CcmF